MQLHRAIVIFTVLCLASGTGCASLPAYLEGAADGIREKQQMHEAAHDARRAKHQAHHDAKTACQQQQLAQLQAQTIPQLRTDIRTSVVHRIEIDQPTVDVDELKKLMAKLEEENKPIRDMRARIEAEARKKYVEAQERYMRSLLAKISGEESCCVRLPPCPPPQLPGQLPPEKAMLPTEIPLVMRARLQLSVEESQYERAEIERVPSLPAQLPKCAPPCKAGHRGPEQVPPGNCPGGYCPLPGPPVPTPN